MTAAAAPGTRAEAAAAAKKQKRSPWTWPLIALIVLLAIVLTGTLIALFNQDTPAPVPSTTASSTPKATPSVAPTPVPTPTSTSVSVLSKDFVGLTSAEARDKLIKLDLVADLVPGNAADDPDKVDLVYDVNPTGTVQKGTTITVKYFTAAPTPETPTAAPTVTPATVPAGTDVTVSWTAQSCPSGQDLTGYEILVEGAGATSPEPTGPDATSTTITTGPDEGQFTAKFRYVCSGGESGYSPASTPAVLVTAATP